MGIGVNGRGSESRVRRKKRGKEPGSKWRSTRCGRREANVYGRHKIGERTWS